jgi:hypothetical protein
MNANRRASLISNTAYCPPALARDRIRAEIAADWRTFKVIVIRAVRAPSFEAWFFIAAAIFAGIGTAVIRG